MSFDDHALAYDQQLRRGLRWAGQGPDWFARRRVALVQEHLQATGAAADTLLEFGCGIGNHVPFFRQAFHNSRIIGVDVSRRSLSFADRKHAGGDVRFCTPEEFQEPESVDLVYVNGVFHHIPPEQHAHWLRYFHRVLRPHGTLAIFDNNPFSLPARLVMRFIPFDRDAVMVNPYRFSKLLFACGFTVVKRRFHFVFPRMLGFLRPLEPALAGLPAGAQYCLFAVRG